MPHVLLIRVIPLIARYGYAVLLPVAVFEGPATAAITGALVAAGQFDGVIACLLLVAADLIGDALYYGLGRYGHGPLLGWVERWMRITPERLKRVEDRFHANDWQLIMLAKTQALGGLILYFAGASRMSFPRYMVFNLIGTFPKVILFEMVGYFLGASILQTSSRRLDYVTFALFAVAMLLLGSYWLVRRRLFKALANETSP